MFNRVFRTIFFTDDRIAGLLFALFYFPVACWTLGTLLLFAELPLPPYSTFTDIVVFLILCFSALPLASYPLILGFSGLQRLLAASSPGTFRSRWYSMFFLFLLPWLTCISFFVAEDWHAFLNRYATGSLLFWSYLFCVLLLPAAWRKSVRARWFTIGAAAAVLPAFLLPWAYCRFPEIRSTAAAVFWLISIPLCLFLCSGMIATLAGRRFPLGIGRSLLVLAGIFVAVYLTVLAATLVQDCRIAGLLRERSEYYRQPLTPETLRDLYYAGHTPNNRRFGLAVPEEDHFKDLPPLNAALPERLIELTTGRTIHADGVAAELTDWKNDNLHWSAKLQEIVNAGYLRMERDYTTQLYRIQLPEQNALRRWAYIHRALIKLALRNRQPETALHLYRQARWFQRQATQDPLLISYLVVRFLDRIHVDALEAILDSEQFTPEQLQTIRRELADDAATLDCQFNRAQLSELILQVDTFRQISRGYLPKNWDLWFDQPILTKQPVQASVAALRLMLPQPYLIWTVDFQATLREDIRLTALAKRPYNSGDPDWKTDMARFSRCAPFTWLNNPIDRIIQKKHAACALYRCVDAGIAAELYRRRHGVFPDNWEQLIPEFLPAAPTDPFTGQPLQLESGRLTVRVTDASLPRRGGKYQTRELTVAGLRISSAGYDPRKEIAFTITCNGI
ncbi:DUF2339 domain-containing protein [Victivallis vadensis]|uniref:DUF2339 domain-containing protein n=1 Tax=Victivallis vadensis TaxID=172901 RepID=A0A848AS34_9BACT|nr:hypothetical protein [Victivallis vadensis]NMD85928.1 DUF2339 domain-containing protein [Victivallis vadensis]